jgi:23S rRNA A2030 N6-methylase RlmJ
VVHIVTYDLESPHDTAEDYTRVIDGLKSTYTTWCHLEKSVWLVVTDQAASEVRDSLKRFLHNTDILFVARLSGNWGSFNLSSDRAEWLKGRTF